MLESVSNYVGERFKIVQEAFQRKRILLKEQAMTEQKQKTDRLKKKKGAARRQLFLVSAFLLLTVGMLFPAGVSKAAKNAACVERAESNSSFCKKVNAFEEKLLCNSKQIWAAPDPENDFQLCRLIVEAKGDYEDFDACGGAVIHGPDCMSVIQYRTAAEAEAAYEVLKKDPKLRYVEPDKIICATDTVTETEDLPDADDLKERDTQTLTGSKGTAETMRLSSWGTEKTHCDVFASYLKKKGKTKEIQVAVVDSGIASDHPFLKGRILKKKGKDFIDGDNNPYDENDHGTHVAGTIVDCTKGCDNIKIYGVRVLNANGAGSTFLVAQGILYAGKKKADVINLSLGGDEDKSIDSAIEKVSKKGTIVVAAAGNETKNTADVCPAHIRKCITVAAVNSELKRAYFSNYGSAVDLCAPGVNIRSCVPGGGYAYMSGTSMAAPHVSAMAAMIKVLHPSYHQNQMHEVLKKISGDLGSSGRDVYYGEGFPDMRKAIPKYKIKPTKVVLAEKEVSICLSATKQLQAEIKPYNTTETKLTWSSSDPEIVSVTQKGQIRGLALGMAKITAKTVNGKKAVCVVTVKKQPVYPTELQLLEPEELTMEIGEVYTCGVKLLPENATETTLKWSSSNLKAAVVNAEGVITAVGEGSTLITAQTVNGLKDSLYVRVKPLDIEAEAVEVSPESLSLCVGESAQLVETVLPEKTTNKLVTWKSEDVGIARVSFQGVVTAVSNGTTVITVKTVNGKTASCLVTVSDEPENLDYEEIYTVAELQNITMSKNYILMNDLDLSGIRWSPLGTSQAPYTGVFNGNGYQITGMELDTAQLPQKEGYGLFGVVSGTIENLSVSGDCTAAWNLSVSQDSTYAFGGIAGIVKGGKIRSCYSDVVFQGYFASSGSGKVTVCVGGICGSLRTSGAVTDCVYTGILLNTLEVQEDGCLYSGGIVGELGSTADVINCSNEGMLTGNGLGSAEGGLKIYSGGLAGYLSYGGAIKDSTNYGSVLADCQPLGASPRLKSSYAYAGGFFGYGSLGCCTDCFHYGAAAAAGNEFVSVRERNDPES